MEDASGSTFFRWTVIRTVKKKQNNKTYWLCICTCGTRKIVRASEIKRGRSKSCGCLAVELAKKRIKHGFARHVTQTGKRNHFWRAWGGIIERCKDKRKNYVTKGIKNLWPSFEDFYRDMYRSYILHRGKHGESNTTLDRIDIDGHYSRENCRWATRELQSTNRSTTVWHIYRNQKITVPQIARKYNKNMGLIYSRLYLGWDITRAVDEPRHKR